MSEYINVKGLVSRTKSELQKWGEQYDVERILEDIEDTLTFDIVRCRECKHRKQKDAGYVCTAFYGVEPWVGDEFFCGNGEKDEEDKS